MSESYFLAPGLFGKVFRRANLRKVEDVDVLESYTIPIPNPAGHAATVTAVASSASNVTLAAENLSRAALLIFNDSTANLYIKFGETVTRTSFTVKIGAGGYFEVPQPPYTGQIDGIWSDANGRALVTEVV